MDLTRTEIFDGLAAQYPKSRNRCRFQRLQIKRHGCQVSSFMSRLLILPFSLAKKLCHLDNCKFYINKQWKETTNLNRFVPARSGPQHYVLTLWPLTVRKVVARTTCWGFSQKILISIDEGIKICLPVGNSYTFPTTVNSKDWIMESVSM